MEKTIKKILFENKKFNIKEFQGRYYLYEGNTRIAELIEGKNSLEKYYFNDFETWIMKVKLRDLKRIDKIQDQISELLKEKNILVDRWGLKYD